MLVRLTTTCAISVYRH